jgi:exosortase
MASDQRPNVTAPVEAAPEQVAAAFGLLPAGLAVMWLVWKAQWFWNHQADLQFGWIVLMLCAYLFYEAWETRPGTRYRQDITSVLLLVVGASFLFLVQIYQAACGMNSASMVGLALGQLLFVMGNLRYVFGEPGVRHFGFAFGFLLIALPMPSVVHNIVVGGLQSKIALLNVEILNLLGIPAQRVGSLIRLPGCTVGIDEACSGVRSLQSTVMATLFIGHLILRRFGLKVLLVGAGVLLALLGNLVRSFFLSYTANARGLQALEAMHDTAGWSILIFTAAGVAALAWLFSRFEKLAEKLQPPATGVE